MNKTNWLQIRKAIIALKKQNPHEFIPLDVRAILIILEAIEELHNKRSKR